jgi:hypothetical protein
VEKEMENLRSCEILDELQKLGVDSPSEWLEYFKDYSDYSDNSNRFRKE